MEQAFFKKKNIYIYGASRAHILLGTSTDRAMNQLLDKSYDLSKYLINLIQKILN